mmetsp:Transcript_7360/g.23186  ORF Transcript_7360/g.23186 Transcript_7360/m.23186 type:complete len:262 (-) Transcript_7360:156-941(-)
MCTVSFKASKAKLDGGITRHSLPSPTRLISNWKSSFACFKVARYARKERAMSAATSANSPSASGRALGPHAARRAAWSLPFPMYFSFKYFSSMSAISSGFSTRGFCSRRWLMSPLTSSLQGRTILTFRTAGPPAGPVGVVAVMVRRSPLAVSSSPSSKTFNSSSASASSFRKRSSAASLSTGASASAAISAVASWLRRESRRRRVDAARALVVGLDGLAADDSARAALAMDGEAAEGPAGCRGCRPAGSSWPAPRAPCGGL